MKGQAKENPRKNQKYKTLDKPESVEKQKLTHKEQTQTNQQHGENRRTVRRRERLKYTNEQMTHRCT